MSSLLRTLETLSKDRHLKALQFYDDLSVASDDESEEAHHLIGVQKDVSLHAKEAVRQGEAARQLVSTTVIQDDPLWSEESTRILKALQNTKACAKDLTKVDDEADALLREGSPPRDVYQRRVVAMTNVVDSLVFLLSILASVRSALLRPTSTADERVDVDEDEEDGETLAEIAVATGFSVAELRQFNPMLLHIHENDVVPVGTTIRLPSVVDAAEQESTAIAAAVVTSMDDDGTHSKHDEEGEEDEDGETLDDIATKTGVPLSTLVELNGDITSLFDPHRDKIPVGTPIRIPEAAASALGDALTSRDESSPPSLSQGRRGISQSSSAVGRRKPSATTSATQSHAIVETLRDVADATGVDVVELRLANPAFADVDENAALPPNSKLVIPSFTSSDDEAAVEASSPQTRPMETLDQTEKPSQARSSTSGSNDTSEPRGDTLQDVSNLYGISIATLVAHNPQLVGIQPTEFLPVGLSIQIPSQHDNPDSDGDETDTVTSLDTAGAAQHSLASLSTSLGVTEESIRDLNPFLKFVASHQILTPGIPIRVPRTQNNRSTHHTTRSASSVGSRSEHIAVTKVRPIPAQQEPESQETLSRLAVTFGITSLEIRRLNPHIQHLGDHTPIPPNTSLQLPKKPIVQPALSDTDASEADEPLPEAERSARALVVDSTTDGDQSQHRSPKVVPRHLLDDDVSSSQLPTSAVRPTLLSIARSSGVPVEALRVANPKLRQYPEHLPLPQSAHVEVPQLTTVTHAPSDNEIDGASDDGEPSLVQDTLTSISIRYHIPVSVIRDHNPSVSHLDKDDPIPQGTALKLPLTPAQRHLMPKEEYRHTDTNHATSGSGGASPRRLPVRPAAAAASVSTVTEYRCQGLQGETLELISALHRVPLSALQAANPVFGSCDTSAPLPSGVILQIPNHDQHQTAPSSLSLPQTSIAPPVASVARTEPSLATLHDEEEPREATPRDTLYSDVSHMEEQLVMHQESQAQLMSPESAPRLESHHQRLMDSSGLSRSPNTSHHSDHRSHDDVTPPESETDDEMPTPSNPPLPSMAASPTTHLKLPTSRDIAEDTSSDALDNVTLIRVEGENIQQLCRRLHISEPALRAANPSLVSYHYQKQLPADTLIRVPVSTAAPTSPRNQSSTPVAPLPSPRQVSKNAPQKWEADGVTSVHDVCLRHFVREDVLREWNPFLRRYHSKTIIPPGTTIFLEAPDIPNSPRVGPSTYTGNDDTYVTIAPGDSVSLKTIALRHGLHEGGIRKLNPHLHQQSFSALLPVETQVCVRSVALSRRWGRIPEDRLKAVDLLVAKCRTILAQRYFLNWKMLSTVMGGKKQLADATLQDERDQLSAEVAVSKLCESDLRRRVTELRMVVDNMRTGTLSPARSVLSPSRNYSPSRDPHSAVPRTAAANNFASKILDRAASMAANGQSPARNRETSPVRRNLVPVTADVGSVGWTSQPDRLTSTSPARAPSGTRHQSPSSLQMRLALALSGDITSQRSATTSASLRNESPRPAVSPRRGQKPSLGLMLNGLRVAAVTGAAAAAGIKVNDAILRVDGRLVSNVLSFREAVQRSPGPRVGITVQHAEGGCTAFMLPLYPAADSERSVGRLSRNISPVRR